MTRRTSSRWTVSTLLALGALASCTTASDVDLVQIPGVGSLVGQAFLDFNGNGVIDAGDLPIKKASVFVSSSSGQNVVEEATTDSLGVFAVASLPVGTYGLALDSAVLGDSLEVLSSGVTVTVTLGGTTQRNLGVSYPTLSLEDVRAAAPGMRVFTSGVALNPRQPNGDGMVFFKGQTDYLRATNVQRAGIAAGDSLRLLGTTALDNGQPTLNAVTPYVLVTQAAFPIAVDLTAGQAASASGGALDAALVRIRDADISDTVTINNDFHFWAHNGTDSVEVVFRSYLGIPTAQVRPDTVVRITQATGLLSPVGDGLGGTARWRLLLRAANEIAYVTKSADVGVGTGLDTLQASPGDTVEIRVTVGNAAGSQFTATGVQVADTVPAELTYVSSNATRGSYDAAMGLWSVGDLAPGATPDTLRILAEVAAAPPTTSVNTARLVPLTHEVELNGGNDAASVTLTIQ